MSGIVPAALYELLIYFLNIHLIPLKYELSLCFTYEYNEVEILHKNWPKDIHTFHSKRAGK